MTQNERTLWALMKMGLTEYEGKIYSALVRAGDKTAGEISFISNVPRPKTYGALKSLLAKGFLKTVQGKPQLFSANSPSVALMPLVEKLTKDIEECNAVLEELTFTYESLKYVHAERPYEAKDFWTMKDRRKVHEKIRDMTAQAKESMYLTTTANGLIRAYKSYLTDLEKAKQRGVDVKIITSRNEANEYVLRELEGIVDVKVTDLSTAKYVCVDSREILFVEAIPDDVSGDGHDVASWTNDPLLVRMHKQLFLDLWNRSLGRGHGSSKR